MLQGCGAAYTAAVVARFLAGVNALDHNYGAKIPGVEILLAHPHFQCFLGNDRRVLTASVGPGLGFAAAGGQNGRGVFDGLPSPFTATRYHSLIVERGSVSADFEVTAWTEDGEGRVGAIMGVRHRTLAVEGVQFHPESILTEHGHQMLKNFLDGR